VHSVGDLRWPSCASRTHDLDFVDMCSTKDGSGRPNWEVIGFHTSLSSWKTRLSARQAAARTNALSAAR
jgi:hypothetical protein